MCGDKDPSQSGTPPRNSALTVVVSSGPPSSGLGVDGNWCYDQTDLLAYGPKSAGAWPAQGQDLLAEDATVVTDPDGNNWTVKTFENVINGNLQILICTPENG